MPCGRRERLVDPLGGGVDLDEVQDVGHGMSFLEALSPRLILFFHRQGSESADGPRAQEATVAAEEKSSQRERPRSVPPAETLRLSMSSGLVSRESRRGARRRMRRRSPAIRRHPQPSRRLLSVLGRILLTDGNDVHRIMAIDRFVKPPRGGISGPPGLA